MRKKFAVALRWFGRAWLVLAVCVILFGYASIWYFQGFGRLTDIISPFNLVNDMALFATIAPGIGALMLAERLER